MVSDELGQKAVSLSFRAARLTVNVLQDIIAKFLQNRSKLKVGVQSLKNLQRYQANLKDVVMHSADLNDFGKILKKYRVDYALKQDPLDKTQYRIFFKYRDEDRLNLAFKDITAARFSEEESKTSVREKIKKIRQEHNFESKKPMKKQELSL